MYEKIMESSPIVMSQPRVQHALSIEMKHCKIELKSQKYEQFTSDVEQIVQIFLEQMDQKPMRGKFNKQKSPNSFTLVNFVQK